MRIKNNIVQFERNVKTPRKENDVKKSFSSLNDILKILKLKNSFYFFQYILCKNTHKQW